MGDNEKPKTKKASMHCDILDEKKERVALQDVFQYKRLNATLAILFYIDVLIYSNAKVFYVEIYIDNARNRKHASLYISFPGYKCVLRIISNFWIDDIVTGLTGV